VACPDEDVGDHGDQQYQWRQRYRVIGKPVDALPHARVMPHLRALR
jgi:hypothetical protein